MAIPSDYRRLTALRINWEEQQDWTEGKQRDSTGKLSYYHKPDWMDWWMVMDASDRNHILRSIDESKMRGGLRLYIQMMITELRAGREIKYWRDE